MSLTTTPTDRGYLLLRPRAGGSDIVGFLWTPTFDSQGQAKAGDIVVQVAAYSFVEVGPPEPSLANDLRRAAWLLEGRYPGHHVMTDDDKCGLPARLRGAAGRGL